MQRKRWLIMIALGAVVVLAVAYGFLPRPVAVDVVTASRGPLMVTVEEEGKTRVKDRFVVSAPVAGFMRRVDFDVGDAVKKGQTVVVLEPLRSSVLDPRSRAAAEAAVSAAEASLRAAEERARAAAADAEYARVALRRTRDLSEAGYTSKDSLDQAESEAKRTEANRLSAEAAVRVAGSELERTRTALLYSAEGAASHGRIVLVSAPVNGRILKVHRESEGVVNSGDPLVDVGDPAKLEVKVEVLSSDAVKVKPGTPVLFERWGGGPALSGKVRIVEPQAFTKVSSLGVEEQRTLVIADIVSSPESWQRLGDGYRVDARFIVWEGTDVLQVPASALFRKSDGWALFVMKEKKARLRQVGVGHRTGLVAEIVSGLSEGEVVITHPEDSIRDGSRVRRR